MGCITATGGGTLRGFVLGEKPVFWVAEPEYLYIAVAASVFTFFVWPAIDRSIKNRAALDSVLNWFDAVSIGGAVQVQVDPGFTQLTLQVHATLETET